MSTALPEWFDQEEDSPEQEIFPLHLHPENTSLYLEESLPDEEAASFLSQVLEFEQAWKHVSMKKLYDILGRPPFFPETDLNHRQVSVELERIIHLFQEHQMSIEMPAGKDPRLLYRFITEYLFDQEIEDLQMEGMTRHFIFNDAFSDRKN